MITEIEDLSSKFRTNSCQDQTQITTNLQYPSQSDILQENTMNRSSSLDSICRKQIQGSNVDNSQLNLNGNNDCQQQYKEKKYQQQDDKSSIISILNDQQEVKQNIDKISMLLESQKLLRRLHKELENLVFRHKPRSKFDTDSRYSTQNGKKLIYKEIKSFSRSRSKEKKKSTKNYSIRCYSPEQKEQKYLTGRISHNKKNKQQINDNIFTSSDKCHRYSRFELTYKDYLRENNLQLNVSSDSNSPQIASNNDCSIDEDEKCLSQKFESMNFKNKKINQNKILYYLNKLEEMNEEEEDEEFDKNTKNNMKQASRRQEKSKKLDDSFESYTTKQEIEQLNEILKNLSIDIQNEVLKVQQQQNQSILPTLETENLVDSFNTSNTSDIENILNNSNIQSQSHQYPSSINKQNIPSLISINSSEQNYSQPSLISISNNSFSSQRYTFKSVEAGMDYVIRKLQNL